VRASPAIRPRFGADKGKIKMAGDFDGPIPEMDAYSE